MKFSTRERKLLSILARKKKSEVSLDQLLLDMDKAGIKKTRHFRTQAVVSMKVLASKLAVFGEDLTVISPIGRGHKAIYKIPNVRRFL